jgi:hypothetical protein
LYGYLKESCLLHTSALQAFTWVSHSIIGGCSDLVLHTHFERTTTHVAKFLSHFLLVEQTIERFRAGCNEIGTVVHAGLDAGSKIAQCADIV